MTQATITCSAQLCVGEACERFRVSERASFCQLTKGSLGPGATPDLRAMCYETINTIQYANDPRPRPESMQSDAFLISISQYNKVR